jgi:hypothetical protein
VSRRRWSAKTNLQYLHGAGGCAIDEIDRFKF